ncbi:MAG: hypothetical protein JWM68_5365 [Verrucomicrobiales bacterium]|nr:hypothetical protein [Verrucomicrobiales bacterium]
MKNLMVLVAVCLGTTAVAQNSTFSYQGRLTENGVAPNGNYDLRFTVYDALTGGNAFGVVTNSSSTVSNGLVVASLDFGANAFNGSARWLEIDVRTNGGGGGFSTLAPRQAILASPYAIRALSATTVSNGVYVSANQVFSGANQFTNTGNTFFGNGGGLTNLNATTVSGVAASGFWQTAGNSNTIAGTHLLGTTDNQALELKVNGVRALRLDPATNGLPNVIGGAAGNTASGFAIAIGGGNSNKVQTANYSIIAGGEGNVIQTGADHSFVGGGYNNSIQSSAFYSTIGGGSVNSIQSGSANATIAGGSNNTNRAFSSSIGGGVSNLIESNAFGSTISGGIFNTIQTNASYGTIGGGFDNSVQKNATYATVAGGNLNTIQSNAQYAVIVGGQNNAVGTNAGFSFAAGRRAKANHPGTFVWADTNNFDFASTETNSFSVRAVGGARFVSAIDTNGVATAGVSLPPGGGGWAALSDRNAKENFQPVNGREVLERIATLPLTTWNYKAQDRSIRHIGPMAQDFASAFQVGEDDTHINTIDEDGVAFAAIQGLHELVEEKETAIHQLKAQNDCLEKRLSDLEELVRSLTERKKGSL